MIDVSIIVTVYNQENLIRSCISSCLNQTYSNIEIIVINDGSTDNSYGIIDDFAAGDRRIKAIHKKNEGVILARKTGREAAKGAYIFFLDGDDFISSDAIENLFNNAQKYNADIAVGDFALISVSGPSIIRKYEWKTPGPGEKFLEHILRNRLHYLVGKLIKRDLFECNFIGIEDNVSIGEDQIQMIQLCMYAGTVTGTDEVVYNYLQHDNSMTHRLTSDRTYSLNQLKYALALYSLKSGFKFNNTIRQQINFRILDSMNRSVLKMGIRSYTMLKSWKIHLTTYMDFIFSGRSKFVKKTGFTLKTGVFIIAPFIPYYYHRIKKYLNSLRNAAVLFSQKMDK